MSQALPPLLALRAFDAVGRTGSVRAASEELRVSHTAVSRHVRNLESRLNVKLVRARGRGIALTQAGEGFHIKVAQAFDAIRQATRELGREGKPALSINCVPGLATRLLVPKLPELDALLPGIEIALQPTLMRADLLHGQCDAEVVYLAGRPDAEGLSVHLLARPRVFPVASPAFVARHQELCRVEDFLGLTLIHEESFEQWTSWLQATGKANVSKLRGTRLWNAHLAIEAARLGQGVALANAVLVRNELADGSLVEVGESDVSLGAYCLIVSASRAQEPAIAILRDYLRNLFAAEAGLVTRSCR